MGDGELTLFLGGDVMTGRGLDQILARPGDPALREQLVTDARTYVDLAESVNGSIPRPAPPERPWGVLLPLLERVRPDVRMVNLETAVTARGEHAPTKGIHYRMHPDNVRCLRAAGLDVCALANNHVLDFGPEGLTDTLDTLAAAGIRAAGAGRDAGEAWRPAALGLGGGRRLLVWSVAAASSGVLPRWAADGGPGVAYLPEADADTAAALADRIGRATRPDDLVLVSVHWGDNWGYEVPTAHVDFAHTLVEAGVDLVHGHSSHHPRPVEVYRDRLILYGCGDLLDDYEGISGYESWRPELRLVHLPVLDRRTGALRAYRAAPVRIRRMSLERAAPDEARWLTDLLDRISAPTGARFALTDDGMLTLRRR